MLEKLNSMSLTELIEAFEKTSKWDNKNKDRLLCLISQHIEEKHGIYYSAYCEFSFNNPY